ncbi:uncharacterized protein LOC123544305 [Mercenaria mercenaria]|uniref:uncharacterized protein LOC123544305 n=1 Tax=Mercenaria mercenaria TaxID=6596 RepID=UPI00234EE231|nr:uncharacterized protein LOC123544305 [Mercenaria mercenaria]XP_053397791.1 uncharacterized protein LOC123544305 [Mercenaria mercenaria]XP_053397805.1 uncharacterized protein LOC123544305 [Mercenaria mercenaria]
MDAIKKENDVLHTEKPGSSDLKINIKIDPYDDVIYMGRTVGPPVVNIDSDEEDELVYISSNRDEGIRAKTETCAQNNVSESEESCNAIHCLETANIKQETGEESKRRRLETGQWNKKRRNISTNTLIKNSQPENNEQCYTATKACATTQERTNYNNSASDTGQFRHTIPVQREGTALVQQPSTSTTPRYKPNCKDHMKSKLGHVSINSQTYFLKYAEDFLTRDEYMFVYKSQDDTVKVFVKSDTEQLFLKTFYDLVTCQHASEEDHCQILPSLQKFIQQTLKQRRLNHAPPKSRGTLMIPEKMVSHGHGFIIMAVYNSDGRKVLVTCSFENCAVFKIFNHYMPEFSSLLNNYEEGENVVTEYENEFNLLKESFLRWMTGKAC